VSISSFKVCRAKTLSSGSSSDRKPSTPEAEVKPGIIDILYLAVGVYRLEVSLVEYAQEEGQMVMLMDGMDDYVVCC
jgi:hypothetical protein